MFDQQSKIIVYLNSAYIKLNVSSIHDTEHPVCQEKDLHPDAVAILSFFNSAITMKQVDRHLSTPSKHGHIWVHCHCSAHSI